MKTTKWSDLSPLGTTPCRTGGFADDDGCKTSVPGLAPKSLEFEKDGYRKGELRTWIARYDLNGQMVWCKSYLAGTFYAVAQDADGSLVAVGETLYCRRSENASSTDVVLYNPTGHNDVNMATVDCVNEGLGTMGLKALAAKYDLDGNMLWSNVFAWEQDYQDAWPGRSRAFGIAPVQVDNASGFYIVGECSTTLEDSEPGTDPFAFRITSDGELVDKHIFLSTDPAADDFANGATDLQFAFSVKTLPYLGQTHGVLSGVYVKDGKVNAFAWHIPDIEQAPYTVDFVEHTRSTGMVAAGHETTRQHVTTDAALVEENGSLAMIWPVLSNYYDGTDVSAGPSAADLRIYRYNVAPTPSNTPIWMTDLGEVRAYDLRAGITSTSDGAVAVVSSLWSDAGPAPEDYSSDFPFCYDDVPEPTFTCLENFASQGTWSGGTCGNDVFKYWNTDALVAKLGTADGQLAWRTQFDAEPERASGCFPDDMRKQECMYQIVEDDEGGLVICGNTSHNFDDAYLARLHSDCQSKVAYEPLTLVDGVYELPNDEDWSTDRNILGTIVVPDGKTLTISSNATIRFADSEQLATRTRLIVKPGGRLITSDNATLTAIESCPNSMWDGIQLHGDEDLPQGTGDTDLDQAYMFSKNTTIKNARVGVLVANDFRVSQLLGKINNLRSGGIIEAETSTFENNVYDVAFSPYENFEPGDPTDILPNRSHFHLCAFKTTGPLADPEVYPLDHAHLAMVRGIPFLGCQWSGSWLSNNYVRTDQLGIGIRSLSSTFHVGAYCSNPPTTYGDPCEEEYETTSSFTQLHRGILANTFDLSRTFWVNRTDFNWNNYAIRMEGIQDASITRNSFKVAQPILPGIAGSLYGIYSDQCTGYTLQENSFTALSLDGDNKKVGLIIKDSGPQYNTFYNNSFDRLHAGSIIQGSNAYDDPSQTGEPGEFAEGLEVKCNDYGVEHANTYDVALTGSYVTIQKTQGSAITDPTNEDQLKNPAGNRFSATHNGSGSLEEDWFVFDGTNPATYFFHTATPGNRTKPDYRDLSLSPTSVAALWPSKAIACPNLLPGGKSKSALRSASSEAHEGYTQSAEEYDATKDDGATASLLAYVSDPSRSSAQVRNALQSVAPNGSVEVFKAAFQRNPSMAASHMAQALISNSPLHPEVLSLMAEYGLPSAYVASVESAQLGGTNLLSVLESDMAQLGGEKAEALYELGTTSWLDSVDLGSSLDSLRIWHQSLATRNGALEVSAVLTAQQSYGLLELIAQAQEQANSTPLLYGVIKRHAAMEQTGSWTEPSSSELNWLQTVGADRAQVGSAHANAWLHAIGQQLPDEVIILPEEGPKSMHRKAAQWTEETTSTSSLVILPNPATVTTFILLPQEDTPDGVLSVRIFDTTGRIMFSVTTQASQRLLQVSIESWALGIYNVELSDHEGHTRVGKLVVQ